jgi:hypothetical protein
VFASSSSSHLHPSNAFGSYTRCASTFNHSRPPSSIGYYKRATSPHSSFNNTKVRLIHHRRRFRVPPTSTRAVSAAITSFETAPKHNRRHTNHVLADGLPLSSLAEQQLKLRTEPKLTILQLSTTHNPKMSLKYFAPVVAIAAGRVAGKRRCAHNGQNHKR